MCNEPRNRLRTSVLQLFPGANRPRELRQRAPAGNSAYRTHWLCRQPAARRPRNGRKAPQWSRNERRESSLFRVLERFGPWLHKTYASRFLAAGRRFVARCCSWESKVNSDRGNMVQRRRAEIQNPPGGCGVFTSQPPGETDRWTGPCCPPEKCSSWWTFDFSSGQAQPP